MSDMIENPFYVDCSSERGYEDIREELKVSEYLIVYWKDEPNDLIYNERLTEDEYDSLLSDLIIVKGDKSVLQKSVSKRLLIRTKIIDQSVLGETDGKVVISLFLNENRDVIEEVFKYKSHDESITDILKKVESVIDMGIPKEGILKRLKVILYSLKDHEYWSDFENCKKNHTIPFIQRKFNYKIVERDSNNKLYQSLSQKQNTDSDYLGEVIKDIMKSERDKPDLTNREAYIFGEGPNYRDHELTLTRILRKCRDYDIDEVADLVISFLLKTKHYWQLYLKSVQAMKACSHVHERYNYKYALLMYYPMRTMYLEEHYTKHNFMNKYNRCVFTLEQALELPINTNYTEVNPYFPLTVSTETNKMNMTKNLFGPMSIDQKFRGFSDMKIFKRNLAIFNPIKKDNLDDPSNGARSIFDNLEFKESCYKCDGDDDCYLCKGTGLFDRFCLVGSMIAFAVPKGHPHIHIFPGDRDQKMWRMMKEYYDDSDQDVMVYAESQQEFKRVVDNTIIPCVLKNLKIGNPEMVNTDLEVKQTEDFTIIVDKRFLEMVCELKVDAELFKEYPDESVNLKQEDYTPDNIENNLGALWVRTFIHKMSKMHADIPNNFDDLNKVKVMVKLPFVKKGEKPALFLCKVLKRVKYIVNSRFMERKLEIFKVQTPYFMNSVSVFHLPCVRAFYNGDTIHMMPSFIFACMTRMNIDYKYFTSCTHPIEIVLKYLQRGYGILLNKVERAQVIEYIKGMPKWKALLSDNPQNVMYRMNYTSLFLKPRQVLNGEDVPYLPNPNDRYISYSYIGTPLKIINKEGFMKPFDDMMVMNYNRWEKTILQKHL